nr:GNAT family N-acetyltransferase [Corynebacterium aquatimens]
MTDDVLATVTDKHTIRFTHVPHPYKQEHLESFLELPSRDIARWALVLDERYAGSIELRTQQQDAVASIGYSAAPWARGRGLVTRAVRMVTQSAHNAGVEEVQIRVAVDNTPSRSVAERAGFTFDRVEAKAEELRGRFTDVAVYRC